MIWKASGSKYLWRDQGGVPPAPAVSWKD